VKLGRVGPFVVLALAALAPTWRFVIGGKVPAPVDQVHQAAPWNGPPAGWDILQIDGALQFLPWRDLVLEAMRKGEVPLWNPYTFGGTPLMANSQSAPLYPLHWLWSLTPFGAESLLSFSCWLHLLIAGAGMYCLVRQFGGSSFGGVLAGCTFLLSAFMIAWVQLPSVGMTAAWIPWCLLYVDRVMSRAVWKDAAMLGVCGSLMLLAGHLQIAVYGLLACALLALWRCVSVRNLRGLGVCVLSLVLAVCIASPQLAASIQNGRSGHRAQAPTERNWTLYSHQAIPVNYLSVMVSPQQFGMPNEPTDDGATSYWLARVDHGRHYAEMAFYVGPVAIALAVLSLCRRRTRGAAMFLGVLAVLAVLIAIGSFVAKAMYFYVPGWASTGSPGRAAVLFAVAVSCMAGLGISRGDERPNWLSIVAPCAAAGVLAVWAWWFLAANPLGVEGDLYVRANAKSVAFILVFLIGSLLAAAANVSRRYSGSLNAIVFALGIIVPAAAHFEMNPGSDRGEFSKPFPGREAIGDATVAVLNDEWSFFTPAPHLIAPPNSLLPYRIREITGYDSIIPIPLKKRLDDINGKDSAPLVNGNMQFLKSGFDLHRLAAVGVKYLIASQDFGLPVRYRGAGWMLLEVPNPAPNELEHRFSEIRYAPGSSPDITDLSRMGWKDAGNGVLEYRPSPYVAGFLAMMLGIFGASLLYCCAGSNSNADDRNSP